MKSRIVLVSLVLFFLFAWNAYTQAGIESETNSLAEKEESSETAEADSVLPDPTPIAPPEGKRPLTLLRLSDTGLLSSVAFLVDKSTRTLTIWKFQNNTLNLVAYYPSDMGRKPGDKEFLGDLKTPEGIYFFQNKYEGKQLDFNEYGSRAFTINYPNFFDALDNKTGSGIWLHAIPQKKSLQRGSRGCVVVRDEVIQKVSELITLKQTPIIIEEQVSYVSPDSHVNQLNQISSWLENWRKSWETKDIDAYIEHYDQQFKSLGMNRSLWKSYKENLNTRYQFIQVQTQDPLILVHNNEAVIKFMQHYQSDLKSDYGEKTLYLKKDASGEFKIVGEEWSAVGKKITAAELKASNENL